MSTYFGFKYHAIISIWFVYSRVLAERFRLFPHKVKNIVHGRSDLTNIGKHSITQNFSFVGGDL